MARRGGAAALAFALLSMSAVDGGAQTPDQETVFWQSIANSTNPADFEAYLEEFPDGVFRRLAGNRLEALRDAAGPPSAAGAPVGGVGSTAPDWELTVESPYDACVYIDVVPSVFELLEVVDGPAVAKGCSAKVRCVSISVASPSLPTPKPTCCR